MLVGCTAHSHRRKRKKRIRLPKGYEILISRAAIPVSDTLMLPDTPIHMS
jgi:hypothetical protein